MYEIQFTANHQSALQYFSMSCVSRIVSNLDQFFYSGRRQALLEDMHQRYQAFLKNDQYEFWLQDL